MADSAPANGNKYKVKTEPIISSNKNEKCTNNTPIDNNNNSKEIITSIKLDSKLELVLKAINPVLKIHKLTAKKIPYEVIIKAIICVTLRKKKYIE